jgi:hypothetical protein
VNARAAALTGAFYDAGVKKLIVQCHAGRTMIVQEGASFYKDFVGINLLKLPQLGKKLHHDRNDTDEANIEMSHSSSNDDDWWVQKH